MRKEWTKTSTDTWREGREIELESMRVRIRLKARRFGTAQRTSSTNGYPVSNQIIEMSQLTSLCANKKGMPHQEPIRRYHARMRCKKELMPSTPMTPLEESELSTYADPKPSSADWKGLAISPEKQRKTLYGNPQKSLSPKGLCDLLRAIILQCAGHFALSDRPLGSFLQTWVVVGNDCFDHPYLIYSYIVSIKSSVVLCLIFLPVNEQSRSKLKDPKGCFLDSRLGIWLICLVVTRQECLEIIKHSSYTSLSVNWEVHGSTFLALGSLGPLGGP